MLDMVSDFLDQMEVNGLSPNTLKAYRSDLLLAMEYVTAIPANVYSDPATGEQEIELMRPPRGHVEKALSQCLRDGLEEGWAIRTHNRRLSTFRRFGQHFGWSDFLATYKRPSTPPAVPHPLAGGVEDVVAMLEATTKAHHKALIALCGLCGCRVGEARTVRPNHVELLSDGRVLLTVVGKGRRTRIVPMSDRALMEILPRLIECHESNERLVPLSDSAARRAFNRIGKRVLGRDGVASHDFRMTAGTAFFAKSKNLRAVQELLGHASSATTEGYTFVSLDTMQEAVDIA